MSRKYAILKSAYTVFKKGKGYRMKLFCKLLALALIALVTVTAFTGCSASFRTLDEIKKDGTIVMLTNAEFPPYESFGEGENIVGVDIDIANEIAKDLGVKLDVKHMKFDNIIAYVKGGRGDFGAAGFSITEERKESVDFSVEYTTSRQYIIVPKGTETANFSLEGKIIGVQAGTTGDMIAGDAETKAKQVMQYPNASEAVDNMLLGRADCVMIDKLPAEKITAARDGKAICFDPGFEPESYAIVVAKENKDLLDAINTTLQRLLNEGKIEEYLLKHS